jgi:hypothetical protein
MEYAFSLLFDFRLHPTVNCCGFHANNVLQWQHVVKRVFGFHSSNESVRKGSYESSFQLVAVYWSCHIDTEQAQGH